MLDRVVPSVDPVRPLSEVLDTLDASGHPGAAALDGVRAAFDHLAGVESAELDLLFRETLDLCTHRLDAWITSLAAERLAALRQARPGGVLLGGYGWVEGVRRGAAPTPVNPVPAGESAPLVHDPANGGFVAAPSLAHAATAAILRSGYLALGGGSHSAPFAVDLSSERVRLAEWILDGVREGQPLGALLGYRFERSLREDPALVQYTRALRIFAPLGRYYQLEAEKKARIDAELAALITQQNAAQGVIQQAIDALTTEINTLTGQINTKTTTKNTKVGQRTTLQNEVAALNTEILNLETQIASKVEQRGEALRLRPGRG